jgi:hypothetical protein
MLRHLEKNKVLTTLNHDFRSGYSCETQLLITINDLLKSCDKGKQIDMAILDFSKAFDTRADPGFQVRGVHLKKLRRAEGGAKIFGVFRVKNHDFTQKKNHIFSNFGGGGGGLAGCAPPLDTVPHKKLLHKLDQYGIRGPVHK